MGLQLKLAHRCPRLLHRRLQRGSEVGLQLVQANADVSRPTSLYSGPVSLADFPPCSFYNAKLYPTTIV